MTLIDRYVVREVTGPTLLGLLVWTSLFLVQRFFQLAERWTQGLMTLSEVGQALLYLTPSVLTQTIPMSALLGVLIGFSRLSADSEITALRAAGVSYYRLLAPTLVLGVLAWGASAALYLKAVPWSNHAFVELSVAAAGRADLNREIEPGRWVHEGGAHVHARSLDLEDPAHPWLTDVDIVLGKRGERREYLHAGRARIDRVYTDEDRARLELVLHDVQHVTWDPAEQRAARAVSAVTRRPLEEVRLPESRRPAQLFKGLRAKSIPELQETIEDLNEMEEIDAALAAGGSTPQLEARKRVLQTRTPWLLPQRRERLRADAVFEVHKKFAIPVACIVFVLAGMPLGIATRRGGRPASFVISIVVVLLWWVVYALGEAWMRAGHLSPAAAAWLPDLVVLTVGANLLVRMRRQQAVGLYRGMATTLLLSAIVLLLLHGLLVLETWIAPEGTFDPNLPDWPWIGGLSALGLLLVLRLFRDPVSAALARLAEAFRRPSAAVGSLFGSRSEVPPAFETPRGLRSVEVVSAAPAGTGRGLERVRAVIVFSMLALVAVAVLQVFEHEGGLREGLAEVLLGWQALAFVLGAFACAMLQRRGIAVVKTLDGWVLGSYLLAMLTVLASMMLLWIVIQYVELTDDILENDIGSDLLVEYFANLAPRIVFECTPYAAMVAALAVFGVMTKFNETTALRCLGVSVFRLVAPVALVAWIVSGAVFVLHDYVVPSSNRRAEELREVIRGRPPVMRFGTRGFVFARDNRTLYLFERFIEPGPQARAVTGPTFRHLTVVEVGDEGRVERLHAAPEARWQDGHWLLHDGWSAAFLGPEEVELEPFEKKRLARVEEPAYFAAERVDPSEMTFSEYRDYVDDQRSAGYPTGSLQVRLHRKLAFPSATLVLVLVGLPFAFKTGRHGALYGIGIALIVAISYYAALATFDALGNNGYLPPLVAAWAPNALFAGTGVWLLLGIRT